MTKLSLPTKCLTSIRRRLALRRPFMRILTTGKASSFFSVRRNTFEEEQRNATQRAFIIQVSFSISLPSVSISDWCILCLLAGSRGFIWERHLSTYISSKQQETPQDKSHSCRQSHFEAQVSYCKKTTSLEGCLIDDISHILILISLLHLRYPWDIINFGEVGKWPERSLEHVS